MGRILLKNIVGNAVENFGMVKNGPATSLRNDSGVIDNDIVAALPCHIRPVQAGHWFNQHREEHWPTNDMIQYCKNMGCFVVGVGTTGSVNEVFEWRISTSHAERDF
jgi:hypothetical protein